MEMSRSTLSSHYIMEVSKPTEAKIFSKQSKSSSLSTSVRPKCQKRDRSQLLTFSFWKRALRLVNPTWSQWNFWYRTMRVRCQITIMFLSQSWPVWEKISLLNSMAKFSGLTTPSLPEKTCSFWCHPIQKSWVSINFAESTSTWYTTARTTNVSYLKTTKCWTLVSNHSLAPW